MLLLLQIVEGLRKGFNARKTYSEKYRRTQLKQLKLFFEECEKEILAALKQDLGKVSFPACLCILSACISVHVVFQWVCSCLPVFKYMHVVQLYYHVQRHVISNSAHKTSCQPETKTVHPAPHCLKLHYYVQLNTTRCSYCLVILVLIVYHLCITQQPLLLLFSPGGFILLVQFSGFIFVVFDQSGDSYLLLLLLLLLLFSPGERVSFLRMQWSTVTCFHRFKTSTIGWLHSRWRKTSPPSFK